jgi:uncharacterized protein (DUF1330 family)
MTLRVQNNGCGITLINSSWLGKWPHDVRTVQIMRVSNALHPTSSQLKAARARDDGQAICMVNLLKFREKAVYADGRSTTLSGAEAYDVYGRAMTRMVIEAGGKLVFSGKTWALLIGAADESWDHVAVMMYPSFKVMTAITMSAAYAEIHVHRDAGLAGQLLIETVKP